MILTLPILLVMWAVSISAGIMMPFLSESRCHEVDVFPCVSVWYRLIGNLRIRLPVAAKIAFATAGLTVAVGTSPTPPGGLAALHHVRLDNGGFVNSHWAIVVEV